jgi:hypothetical protein
MRLSGWRRQWLNSVSVCVFNLRQWSRQRQPLGPLNTQQLALNKVLLERRVIFINDLKKEATLRPVADVKPLTDARADLPASEEHDHILAKTSCPDSGKCPCDCWKMVLIDSLLGRSRRTGFHVVPKMPPFLDGHQVGTFSPYAEINHPILRTQRGAFS